MTDLEKKKQVLESTILKSEWIDTISYYTYNFLDDKILLFDGRHHKYNIIIKENQLMLKLDDGHYPNGVLIEIELNQDDTISLSSSDKKIHLYKREAKNTIN